MVKELFESLLDELGTVMDIPDLHPDRNHTCLITFPNKLDIQIEMESHGRNIVIGTELGNIPAGRYRENIFREALKINGTQPPLHGVLSYSNKSRSLVLFEKLPTKDLTGEKIADALTLFSEKALSWKEALIKGEVPTLVSTRSSGGIFGLHP
jgi:hypothetical protein